ncbi:hypothetical protein H9M94_01915 [Mycoplasma sp. Pen4]|uniref:hypothetical protein n=1 Tax=Mycoplasma sp. Pen4 TaxID=640330 RepID=UPI001654144B|nr:hypothetical protein [Mycoplasma sp. Pen4]QNM93367.1 hypothetical protein H9M94_01915 [Mycoplasma sp. Pen4]
MIFPHVLFTKSEPKVAVDPMFDKYISVILGIANQNIANNIPNKMTINTQTIQLVL